MGLESANYHYVPRPSDGERLPLILTRQGARHVHGPDQQFAYYVLSGPDHWIDVQVGTFSDVGYPSASIRVAVTNPPAVADVLRRILSALLDAGGGYVVDHQDAHRRREAMDDAEWEQIWVAFQVKRAEFRQNFGEIEAAVSGAEVFRLIRERNSS